MSRLVRAATDIDERYMIGLDEHVNAIGDAQLQSLGILIGVNNGVQTQWKVLAWELGLTNDDILNVEAVPQTSGSSYGYDVLKLWRQREKSTVRVLRKILLEMKRDDAVDKLDDCRLNKVTLVIIIKSRDNDEIHEISLAACPGRKWLLDVVRPALARKFASVWTSSRGTRITFSLQRSLRSGLDWNSQCREFAGQQITLEMHQVSNPMAQPRPLTNPPTGTATVNGTIPRAARSWIEDDMMCFGYVSDASEVDPEFRSSTSIEYLIYENPENEAASPPRSTSANPERRMSGVCVQESSVDFQLSSCDECVEITEAKRLEFYRDDETLRPDERRQWAETILKGFKRQSGIYLLRRSSDTGGIKLAITVTGHHGRIHHFGVFSDLKSTGQRTYGIFKDEFEASSLSALFEHYRLTPLRTQGSDRGVCLKNPIQKS